MTLTEHRLLHAMIARTIVSNDYNASQIGDTWCIITTFDDTCINAANGHYIVRQLNSDRRFEGHYYVMKGE